VLVTRMERYMMEMGTSLKLVAHLFRHNQVLLKIFPMMECTTMMEWMALKESILKEMVTNMKEMVTKMKEMATKMMEKVTTMKVMVTKMKVMITKMKEMATKMMEKVTKMKKIAILFLYLGSKILMVTMTKMDKKVEYLLHHNRLLMNVFPKMELYKFRKKEMTSLVLQWL